MAKKKIKDNPEKLISSLTGIVSWKATAYLGRDAKGRQIKPTKTFSKKEDAKGWLTEQLHTRKGLGRNLSDERKKTLDLLINEYLIDLHTKKKDNTYNTYRQQFKKWITPYFESYTLEKISKPIIQNFVDYLKATGNSDTNTHFIFNRLISFLEWAKDNDLIYQLPTKGIELKKLPVSKSKKVKFHDKADLKKLFTHAQKSYYYDFFIFLYNTGLRIGEGAAVRVKDIDLERGLIHVAKQFTKYTANKFEPAIPGAFFLDDTKGAEDRIVPLNDAALAVLNKLCAGKKKGDFVFLTKAGKLRKIVTQRGIKPKTIEVKAIDFSNFTNDIYKPMQERAKLENILGVHGTRHTYGANYIMAGRDVYELKKILGHKDISSTEIYAHLSPEYLAESKNIFNIGL